MFKFEIFMFYIIALVGVTKTIVISYQHSNRLVTIIKIS